MPVVRATRRVHFCSAHRLFRPDWTDEENAAVFGACSNPNWHGHNYVLDVTVEGPVDPETGFVMDLKQLKTAMNEQVVDDVDHRNLNLEVPWFSGVLPSTALQSTLVSITAADAAVTSLALITNTECVG